MVDAFRVVAVEHVADGVKHRRVKVKPLLLHELIGLLHGPLTGNMLHSDYSKTLSKYGVSMPEAYAELAKDWIEIPLMHVLFWLRKTPINADVMRL